ncbi:LysR family transcriptional regulator [Caldimonas brevitalea]|uniref:LysR family transcriptional regulator n=1 Tax=Caldimonas brevitalea TaxID=413882 RepID=A0A0G3BL50_9BURK|nr:LysR family transcriptional regulator [Caldimonas brevitalea]AKJ30127.1 LysR family transcriptional regulator [Caldimonas brevitalea]
MADPQRLDLFAKVVEAGSISRAAVRHGVDKSVVSRQIAKLEAELGARLLQRTTRRLSLTEIGEQVLQEALRIREALLNVEQMADAYQQEVRGRLRVGCSMASRRVLVPVVIEFCERHPQVQIALQSEDRLVDLVAERIDVALRTAHLAESSLVARKLVDNRRVVVAAPSYLARHGAPRTPDELRDHACLVYCNASRCYDQWRFDGPDGRITVQVPARMQMNDGGALADAAVAGGGVVLLDRLLVQRELQSGALQPLLTDYSLPDGPPIYAVYPARHWLAPKTTAFVDFLQQHLSFG